MTTEAIRTNSVSDAFDRMVFEMQTLAEQVSIDSRMVSTGDHVMDAFGPVAKAWHDHVEPLLQKIKEEQVLIGRHV